MNMNRAGRPTSAQGGGSSESPTFTGNRALVIEEPLLFEVGDVSKTGVDLDEPEAHDMRLGALARSKIGLPGLTEPEVMRHYVRLSQKNYAIDTGLYPLGSCTMKHNPRLNETMARLPGFADIHPFRVAAHQGHDFGADQTVIQHHIGALHQAQGAKCQQIGISGTGANQIDFTDIAIGNRHILQSLLHFVIGLFLLTGQNKFANFTFEHPLPESSPRVYIRQ